MFSAPKDEFMWKQGCSWHTKLDWVVLGWGGYHDSIEVAVLWKGGILTQRHTYRECHVNIDWNYDTVSRGYQRLGEAQKRLRYLEKHHSFLIHLSQNCKLWNYDMINLGSFSLWYLSMSVPTNMALQLAGENFALLCLSLVQCQN